MGSFGDVERTLTNAAAAYVNGHIYVVAQCTNVITVYKAQLPFTEQQRLAVGAITGVKDIVACSINSCCYVADSNGVWRVKVSNLSNQQPIQDCEIWLKKTTVQSLSITADGNILATEFGKPSASDNHMLNNKPAECDSLRMYNSKGLILFEIPLNVDDLKGVLHAIQTPTGSIIVCQADKEDDKLQRISEIDIHGTVIRRYGGERGGGLGQLNNPNYLVHDFARRWLFVCDYFNHKVLLFDKNLRLRGILVKDEKDWFYKLCYVKELSMLLISSTYGVVEVYRVLPMDKKPANLDIVSISV